MYLSIILASKVILQFLETTADIVLHSQGKVIARFVNIAYFVSIFREGFAPLPLNTMYLLQRTHHLDFPLNYYGFPVTEGIFGEVADLIAEGILCRKTVRSNSKGGSLPKKD